MPHNKPVRPVVTCLHWLIWLFTFGLTFPLIHMSCSLVWTIDHPHILLWGNEFINERCLLDPQGSSSRLIFKTNKDQWSLLVMSDTKLVMPPDAWRTCGCLLITRRSFELPTEYHEVRNIWQVWKEGGCSESRTTKITPMLIQTDIYIHHNRMWRRYVSVRTWEGRISPTISKGRPITNQLLA